MRAIVWQERYKCNFSCPYCYIYMRKQGNLPIWTDVVKAFNKLAPQTLDITGGEPFLNPNLVDIINGLTEVPRIGLTTNLSQDIRRFVQEVSPEKVISITLSYHPSQRITAEAFIGKALLLQQRGFKVTVNFVSFPEQMYLLHSTRQMFNGLGIRFHVDPFMQESHEAPYTYTEAEQRFLRPFIEDDRAYRIDGVDDNVVLCSAGRDYLQVSPEGDAYRCMIHHLHAKDSIGNIFDPDFKLFEEDKICSDYGMCAGCDRDKATITKPKVHA